MNWFKEDFKGNSKHLVIALGSFYEGLDRKYNPNQFEWDRTMTEISDINNFKKLYVKDVAISWWHGKFEGLGHGIHVVADFLKKESYKAEVDKVLVIGPSLGGYGALMFTCLCNFDVAIAISPQTNLTNFRYKKNRLNEKFEGLNVNKEETDVKYIMENYGKEKSKYFIFYGDKHSGDVKAANRLSHFPNVFLKPLDSAHHTVARMMKNDGITKDMILKFVRDEL
jgi:hypothetical protein